MMMMFLRGALPLCVMVLGTSCKQASSADETPSPPPKPLPGNVVHGTVNYAGQERGLSLYVGLIREQESTPYVARQIKWPTFPASYAFPNVPPGKYTVTSYLSTGTDHPAGPDPKDPYSPPLTITVATEGVVEGDLTLLDPSSRSTVQ